MTQIKLATIACACALAVATAVTPTASATTAGWMVNGTALTGTKALATTAAVDQSWKFKSAGVTIECQGATTSSTAPKIQSTGGGASSVSFTECFVTNESCTVTKTITTLPVTVEVTLDSTLADKATFKPATKTTFVTIQFGGETCALLGTQSVTGKAGFLIPTGQDERTLQRVEAAVTEASGELKVGSSPAEISGSVLPRLASSEPWSFL